MELLIQTLFQLTIIITCAKLVGEFFEFIKQPAVVGELMVGMLIGPYALGWVHHSEVLHIFSELAVIFLLFHVGLETRFRDMMKVGSKSLWVALLGVVLPFLAGYAYLAALNHDVKTALFLGTAMVATSVGITARVLGDLKFMKTRESRIILGAAVIDDVLGMIVLAIVSGISQGEFSNVNIIRITLVAIAFVVLVVLVGTWGVRMISPYLHRLKTRNMPVIIALTTCFGLAALAQVIGLAAIIGAFLAGMVFADTPEEHELEKKIEPMVDFYVPVFFVIMGTSVNIALFTNVPILLMALLVTVMAVLTKLVGCGMAVIKEGVPTALVVGIGMVPRGEVGLIIASIGAQLKIFPNDIYAVIVFMCMATTLLMPPFMQMAVKYKLRAETSKSQT